MIINNINTSTVFIPVTVAPADQVYVSAPSAIKLTVSPGQTLTEFTVRTGKGNIVITSVAIAVSIGQGAKVNAVLVTVYVPGVLADRSITPVVALMLNPAVELKVPATPPAVNVGDGTVAFLQNKLSV